MPPRKGLKVVKPFGTPKAVVEVLSESLVAAQDDEILAIAVIEVRQGGDVAYYTANAEAFRHQLYAGCGYAMRHIEDDE